MVGYTAAFLCVLLITAGQVLAVFGYPFGWLVMIMGVTLGTASLLYAWDSRRRHRRRWDRARM